ncbi:hypothetical protein FDECE_14673 [Fusarium decemcellulare]|nr:hypothetical protein FDECE_14673 [Fusarium decemcellulare]
MPDGFCRSGCPSDRVRVALDTESPICSVAGVGRQATCCKTSYYDEVLVPNEKLQAYEDAMNEWVKSETCPNPSKIFSKRHLSSSSTELAVRADKVGDISVQDLLIRIIAGIGSQVMLDQYRRIWNAAVQYEYLQITYISNYIRNNWLPEWQGPAQTALEILCSPLYWADKIKAFVTGDKTDTLNCTYSYCDIEGYCEYLGDGEGSVTLKRRHATLRPLGGGHLGRFAHSHIHHNSRQLLQTRKLKNVEVKDPDNEQPTHEYQVDIPANPTVETIAKDNPNNPLLDDVVVFSYPDECRLFNIHLELYKDLRNKDLEIEHVVDKHILETFIEESALGKYESLHNRYACLGNLLTELARLKSRKTSKYGPIPIAFWDRMEEIDLEAEPGLPKLPGDTDYKLSFIMDRMFECLGSARHFQNFMAVDIAINAAKRDVMQLHRTVGKNYVTRLLRKGGKSTKEVRDDTTKLLARIRGAFSTFRYMELDQTQKKLNNIVKEVRVQCEFAEKVYNKKYPNEKVRLADYWIEWMKDYYEHVTKTAKDNVLDIVAEVLAQTKGETGPLANKVNKAMGTFRKVATNGVRVHIDTSGFPTDGDTDMGGT